MNVDWFFISSVAGAICGIILAIAIYLILIKKVSIKYILNLLKKREKK